MADVISAVLKTQDIVGKPVITLQGEELGSILRVIVNPENRMVAGFTINIRGLFKGEKSMEFDTVNSFGDYAVIVESSEKILPFENLPVMEILAKDYDLYNMRVVTPQGKLIGTIDDFYFNTATGHIDKYILSGGIIKNLFKGKAVISAVKIRSIGKDVLIAVDGAEDTIEKEDSSFQDSIHNLKGEFDSFKGDFEQLKEDMLSKTSEILNEKKKHLQASYEWWLDRLQLAKTSPDPLPEHDVNILIGLKAGRIVLDNNGQPIVKENEEITREVVDSCQKTGKTRELLISIASKDLEDKIKSIEEDKLRSIENDE